MDEFNESGFENGVDKNALSDYNGNGVTNFMSCHNPALIRCHDFTHFPVTAT